MEHYILVSTIPAGNVLFIAVTPEKLCHLLNPVITNCVTICIIYNLEIIYIHKYKRSTVFVSHVIYILSYPLHSGRLVVHAGQKIMLSLILCALNLLSGSRK